MFTSIISKGIASFFSSSNEVFDCLKSEALPELGLNSEVGTILGSLLTSKSFKLVLSGITLAIGVFLLFMLLPLDFEEK